MRHLLDRDPKKRPTNNHVTTLTGASGRLSSRSYPRHFRLSEIRPPLGGRRSLPLYRSARPFKRRRDVGYGEKIERHI
jgi:hypothetical protein